MEECVPTREILLIQSQLQRGSNSCYMKVRPISRTTKIFVYLGENKDVSCNMQNILQTNGMVKYAEQQTNYPKFIFIVKIRLMLSRKCFSLRNLSFGMFFDYFLIYVPNVLCSSLKGRETKDNSQRNPVANIETEP